MYTNSDEVTISPKTLILSGITATAVLLIFFSINVIQPQERALVMTLGNITDEVGPGLRVTLPFFQGVEKYNMSTLNKSVDISVSEKGAITKDNQTIGSSITVFYRIKQGTLRELKTQYGIDRLEQIIVTTVEQKFKEEVGKNTIFDIAVKQNDVSESVKKAVIGSLSELPITIDNVQITNYDWSDAFDAQIAETMSRAQQVKQKEQELLITEKESQKIVKEAEAKKQATVLDAEANAIRGEGIRKYNEEIAKTIEIEKQFRQLEIEKIKAEKWNGQYVPSQVFTPIPLDLKGTIQK